MTPSDKGSVTIWMLGLAMLLLVFGGLALDFWRGLALQRELAAVADSAAIAAASGIDQESYRLTGDVALDPSVAGALARSAVDAQDVSLETFEVLVNPDGTSVTVTLEGLVELGLLGVFVDQDEPFRVRASATASPRLVP